MLCKLWREGHGEKIAFLLEMFQFERHFFWCRTTRVVCKGIVHPQFKIGSWQTQALVSFAGLACRKGIPPSDNHCLGNLPL